MMRIDLHTHTIASGHGTRDTLADMAKAALAKGISVLGISDHGPAMLGAARSSYFRNLRFAERNRNGVHFLYGAELSILSEDGRLDLPDDILSGLDYAIASLHRCGMKPDQAPEIYTRAYIAAMKHPAVCVIGHPDNTAFPSVYEELVRAASEHHVLIELNNASLGPHGYRGNSESVDRILLPLCARFNVPILIGSDSHGAQHIGEDENVRPLLQELHFPADLIANDHPELLKSYLPLR